MTIGAALAPIAVGAVLKWAVTAHVNGFDIQTAGTVIFIVGLLGLVLSVTYTFWWSHEAMTSTATATRRSCGAAAPRAGRRPGIE
jgi:hypothetical protein